MDVIERRHPSASSTLPRRHVPQISPTSRTTSLCKALPRTIPSIAHQEPRGSDSPNLASPGPDKQGGIWTDETPQSDQKPFSPLHNAARPPVDSIPRRNRKVELASTVGNIAIPHVQQSALQRLVEVAQGSHWPRTLQGTKSCELRLHNLLACPSPTNYEHGSPLRSLW
jgi:hypothetical protein